MPAWCLYVISGIIAYCLGSISFGILISRLFKGPDLRTVGSKNTGASNVQRTMGWIPGLLTFLGDSLKAVLACWLGSLITGSFGGALVCGILVILGHNWPVFFEFRGGKGVASSCGVMIYCFPVPALISYAVCIAVIAATKYISVGSMTLVTVYALIVSCFRSRGNIWIIFWSVLLAVLCIARHKTNIGRLRRGEENRLGHKVSADGKE